MSKKTIEMCPLFPDMPCPQGKNASEACYIRRDSNYDPLVDFKDYFMLNCALHRIEEEKVKKMKRKRKAK